VVDDEECDPIVGAVVDFEPSTLGGPTRVHGRTDAEGGTKCNIGPPPVSVVVRAELPGCRAEDSAVIVKANETTEVEITLGPVGPR
jgi:hypothetical protein